MKVAKADNVKMFVAWNLVWLTLGVRSRHARNGQNQRETEDKFEGFHGEC